MVADWIANTGTTYKVEHYKENIGSGWTLADTDNLVGTSDVQVTPEVKSYTGFTSPSTQTVTILPDGSLVVRYEYTRNSYEVTYDENG